jgi:oligo-1,6-glucosidase
MTDEGSIWNHYRKLIALRKTHDIIVYGEYQSWLDDHPDVFIYTRSLDDQRLTVVASFAGRPISLDLPPDLTTSGRCLITNYAPVEALKGSLALQPYEAFAILSDR